MREQVRYQVSLKLPFLDYAPTAFISARHGSGLGELMDFVQQAYESTMRELSTGEVTRVLEQAVESHQPPAVLGRRIKLRYAHQGGRNPPRIVVHGNQTEKLPAAYKRYLANRFRDAFKLVGVPLLLSFKTGDNPYKGKKNVARLPDQPDGLRSRRLPLHRLSQGGHPAAAADVRGERERDSAGLAVLKVA